MRDPGLWIELFGDTLERLVPAVGWRIDVHDRRAERTTGWVSGNLDHASRDLLKRAARHQRRGTEPDETTPIWRDAVTAAENTAGYGKSIIFFCIKASTTQDVCVSGLLERDAIRGSAFESDAEFVSYCRSMAIFFALATDAFKQAGILHQIAVSISLGGIVADRNGKVVMNIGNRDGEVSDCLKPVFESAQSAKRLLRQMVLEEGHARGKSVHGRHGRPAAEGLIATGGQDRRVLHVIPLRDVSPGSLAGRVLFAVMEPVAARCPSSQSLRRVYALTPAEARVVARLVQGLPIKEIARVLNLSDNTVRTYLKRSFEKVGVSSQQQLIYAVSGMTTEATADRDEAVGATAAQ